MGGDRDGNLNVTADITCHVLLLQPPEATDFPLKDIQVLVSELSMVEATPRLLALVGEEGAAEPYRYLMKKSLRSRLMATQAWWLGSAPERRRTAKPEGLLTQNEELPGNRSTLATSHFRRAVGYYRQRRSVDTLRPREMFPAYRWSVLISVRRAPTIPKRWRADPLLIGYRRLRKLVRGHKQAFRSAKLNIITSAPARATGKQAPKRAKCLDTCQVIAEAPQSIAAYVISMAKTPSDVLAVHLLKEAGIGFAMPVARCLKPSMI